MFKNVAAKYMVFAFDTTTNAPKTGDAANITAYVSKDYGTVTVLGDTSATEMDATNAPGYYLFDAAQAETNADCLMVSGKSSTSNIKVIGAPAVIYTRPTTGWLAPATAGRTLVVDAAGLADANVVKIGPTGSGTAQTARDVGASVLLSTGTGTGQLDFTAGIAKVDVNTIKTQTVTAAAGVTFPTSIASPTNITAGTITTATNLTNAPTSGDFTATMKTSIGTAVAASAVASVTGAVASVTGNVGGNVTGSVGSVVGAVGSVTGLTASNLDATISSRGSAANLAIVAGYLDTEIADIKAKTDLIPAAPASTTNITAGTITTVTNVTNDVGISATAVDNIWDEAVDGSVTARQSMRLQNSAMGAKASGLATATATYRDLADTKARITATVDADGNRTAVTRDLA